MCIRDSRDGDVVGLIHVHQMPQLPSMGLMAGSLPVTEDYHHSIKKSVSESKELLERYEAKCRDQLKCEFKVSIIEAESCQKFKHILEYFQA